MQSLNLQAAENPQGSASSNSYTDVDVGTRDRRNVRGVTRVHDLALLAPQTCAPHRLLHTGSSP